MKRWITAMVLLVAANLLAADFDPFAGAKPVVVLLQTDPWAKVVGADTPRLAVYEDGLVIFTRRSGRQSAYYQRTFSAAELAGFRKRVVLPSGLKTFYNLQPDIFEHPETQFYVREGNREVVTRVLGLEAPDTPQPRKAPTARARKPDPVPLELLKLHLFLCRMDYADSKEWVPKFLEVMLWPYDYASEGSVPWPAEWPGLESPRATKRGDSYSIFLDAEVQPELDKLLRSRKAKGAIELGGKKWAAEYRPVFPGEPVWRKAIDKTRPETSPKR